MANAFALYVLLDCTGATPERFDTIFFFSRYKMTLPYIIMISIGHVCRIVTNHSFQVYLFLFQLYYDSYLVSDRADIRRFRAKPAKPSLTRRTYPGAHSMKSNRNNGRLLPATTRSNNAQSCGNQEVNLVGKRVKKYACLFARRADPSIYAYWW